MSEHRRRLASGVAALLAALAIISSSSLAKADPVDVYHEVLAELGRHPNRLPGSAGYRQSFDRLESVLRSAGLDVHRQRFATEVPRTRKIRLAVGGREVAPVDAMAPNGIAPPTTWGRAIEGPLVYVGRGSLAELDGRSIEGAIAVLEADSEEPGTVFQQGAAAVIVVSRAPMSQWLLAKHFTSLPIALPRAFVDRSVAERFGLLELPPVPVRASLEVEVAWERVEATNLWAKIPARAPTTADPPQAVVASAEVDTFGAVPDHSPDLRSASNVALLADVAARLAQGDVTPRARSFYAVFFGSHYAAEEGARHFYHAWQRRPRAAPEGSCPMATELYRPRAERARRKLALIEDARFLDEGGDDAFDVFLRARRALEKRVSDLSYALQANARERRRLESSDPRAAALSELAFEATVLQSEKTRINGWRGQLAAHHMPPGDGLTMLTATLREQLSGEIDDAVRLAEQSQSSCELRAAARDAGGVVEQVAVHLTFDFADDQRPFVMSPFGADAWSRSAPVTGRTFARQAKVLGDLYSASVGRADPPPGAAPSASPHLYEPAGSFRVDALATPRERSVPGMPAVALGIAAFDLATIGEGADLAADGMPVEVSASLERLAPDLTRWMTAITTVPRFPATSGVTPIDPVPLLVEEPTASSDEGIMVTDLAKGTDETSMPAQDALLVLSKWPLDAPSVEPPWRVGRADMVIVRPARDGHVFAPNVGAIYPWDETSRHVHAFGFDEHGVLDRFTVAGSSTGSRASLHYGSAGAWLTPFTPADYDISTFARWLVGSSDGDPRYRLNVASTAAQVVFQDERAPCKLLGNGTDVLGAGPEHPTGGGEPCDARSLLGLDANRRAAYDYDALSRFRLARLRARNIIDKPLEKMAADARGHIDRARQARSSGATRLAVAHETAANILGERVQRPLRERTNDLVQAVVILLLLSLPFSFVLERLLFGYVSIYRQTAVFAAVFSSVFAVLYFTHPAFSLAAAPVVVFLAFAIMLMSAVVIGVVMGKLKQELKAMQGLASSAHGDVPEGPGPLVALAMAVAGMRNRPIKTWLSALTVALLTFTVLVFTSFGSALGVVETPMGPPRGAARIELHTPTFLDIPGRLRDAIAVLYGERYDVAERGASFADPRFDSAAGELPNLLWNPVNERAEVLEGLLVLDPKEAVRRGAPFPAMLADAGPEADPTGAALPPTAAPLALSRVLASRLGAAIGSRLSIRGQPFRVSHVFEGSILGRADNLDGTPFTPPNFDATLARLRAGHAPARSTSALPSIAPSAFVWSAPDATAVTSAAGAAKLGVARNVLTLYPRAGAAVSNDARELAELVRAPVFASSDEGLRRFFFTQAWGGTGFWDVFVPLLLGGLIIASSLLGSIVERQREIFTWSALGLSPRDVGMLFFAEAAVLAVLGGMGGYLLSQLLVQVLHALAARGLATPPNLDFSSFASLATILLVMATVLLSSVYPSLVAGRSANPGVARRWTMPAPVGDTMRFTFPFTVSTRDVHGIMAFLVEHFENHRDASLGTFAARDIAMVASSSSVAADGHATADARANAPGSAPADARANAAGSAPADARANAPGSAPADARANAAGSAPADARANAAGSAPAAVPPSARGHALSVCAEVALAPFDLGVVQRFVMSTRPSEIAGIDEVLVELERVSGAPSTWLRGNRAFVDDLRQQFLQWRTLPVASTTRYHQRGEELLRC